MTARTALWRSIGGFLVALVLVFPASWLYLRIQLARDIAWVREFEPRVFTHAHRWWVDPDIPQDHQYLSLYCRSHLDDLNLSSSIPTLIQSRIQPLLEEPQHLTVPAHALSEGIIPYGKSADPRVFDMSRISRLGTLASLDVGYEMLPFTGATPPPKNSVSRVDFTFLRHLPELTYLSISGVEFNDRDARELRHLHKLQKLIVYSDGLTDDGLQALRGLSKLEYLRLSSRNIKGPGLAEISNFTSLTHLDVSGIPYSRGLTRHFKNLSKLESLYLHKSSRPIFGDEDLAYLPHTALRSLSLSFKGHQWVSAINEPTFDLAGTQVTDQGLKRLCANKQIRGLDLSRSLVTSAGLQALDCLTSLEGLALRGLEVDDSALRRLAALPRLRILDLQQSVVTDAGLLELQKSRSLREVYVAGTPLTESALNKLAKTIQVRFESTEWVE